MKNTMKGIGPYSARTDRPLCRGVPHVFPPAENPEPGHGRKAVVPRPSRPDGRSAFHSACLPAGVLATVLVVSALMLLSVLGVLALWKSDFLFFSRAGYLSRQRANVESAFVLYAADSTLTARLDKQGGLRLYDGLPDSRVRIAVRPWGLYEAVRIEAADSRIAPTRLFGSAAPFACSPGEESGLWYATDAASLSLAGRTSLHGCLRLPRHGVQYGQIRSIFFCGERIEGARTAYAGKELPPVRTDARRMTDSLLRLLEAPGAWMPTPHSLSVGFGEREPRMLDAGSFGPGTRVEGMAVLLGEEVSIDSACRLRDVLVVGRTIRVGDGFRGRAQLFASDTVLIGQRVTLGYPSGMFVARENPDRYIEIGPHSRIEGYAIVDGDGKPDVKRANYRQDRTAVLRGLLWADGAAQVQGIVSGCMAANRLVYYSPEGYYEDMLYDLTLLENPAAAYPLWAETAYRRKEAGWVR